MYELARRVRFHDGPAFSELEVRCRGLPDPVTGYVMNISEIDQAVRRHAGDRLRDAVGSWISGSGDRTADVLRGFAEAIRPALHDAVSSVRWWPSPYHSIQLETSAMDRVRISRRFEFSAAHRLHCPALSDQENRQRFGKCNNPSGHGHNYKLETDVSVPLEPRGDTLGFAQLERLVEELVIQRFDHKHLNIDTTEFAELNPSVEHIVRVCYELLSDPIAAAGGRLEQVTVWETDKTSCTYPV